MNISIILKVTFFLCVRLKVKLKVQSEKVLDLLVDSKQKFGFKSESKVLNEDKVSKGDAQGSFISSANPAPGSKLSTFQFHF